MNVSERGAHTMALIPKQKWQQQQKQQLKKSPK